MYRGNRPPSRGFRSAGILPAFFLGIRKGQIRRQDAGATNRALAGSVRPNREAPPRICAGRSPPRRTPLRPNDETHANGSTAPRSFVGSAAADPYGENLEAPRFVLRCFAYWRKVILGMRMARRPSERTAIERAASTAAGNSRMQTDFDGPRSSTSESGTIGCIVRVSILRGVAARVPLPPLARELGDLPGPFARPRPKLQ